MCSSVHCADLHVTLLLTWHDPRRSHGWGDNDQKSVRRTADTGLLARCLDLVNGGAASSARGSSAPVEQLQLAPEKFEQDIETGEGQGGQVYTKRGADLDAARDGGNPDRAGADSEGFTGHVSAFQPEFKLETLTDRDGLGALDTHPGHGEVDGADFDARARLGGAVAEQSSGDLVGEARGVSSFGVHSGRISKLDAAQDLKGLGELTNFCLQLRAVWVMGRGEGPGGHVRLPTFEQ